MCRGPTCTNGTVRKHFKVQVPTGAQELELSVKPSTGAVFHASHHNWSPSSEMSEFLSEVQNSCLKLLAMSLLLWFRFGSVTYRYSQIKGILAEFHWAACSDFSRAVWQMGDMVYYFDTAV